MSSCFDRIMPGKWLGKWLGKLDGTCVRIESEIG
jgi:hypothetical protein